MRARLVVMLGLLVVVGSIGTGGCRSYPPLETTTGGPVPTPLYVIGPGDQLNIFVWRNPEVSTSTSVRSDGTITTPLVEDLPATGKTTTQLARELEKVLSVYIRDPIVTVMVGEGTGPFNQQVRVIGQIGGGGLRGGGFGGAGSSSARATSFPYREDMTLLDLMIQVGGLNDFAAGNRASIVRRVNGELMQFRVRIRDLLENADMAANVDIYPGDILIIPESFF